MGERDIQTSVRDSRRFGSIVVSGIDGDDAAVICSPDVALRNDAKTSSSVEARISRKSEVCSLNTEVRCCSLPCLNSEAAVSVGRSRARHADRHRSDQLQYAFPVEMLEIGHAKREDGKSSFSMRFGEGWQMQEKKKKKKTIMESTMRMIE